MADYSLVPVDYQPNFDGYSLVPVEYDPFAGDGVTPQAQSQQPQIPIQPRKNQPQAQQAQFQQPARGASQTSAPTLGVGRTEFAGSYRSALTAGAGDFFKSIPRGIVSGLNNSGSALARATQVEMGQDADAPTPEQGMEILEKEVTGPMHRPEGRAGKFGASVGEFVGNPASYLAPGSLPFKVGTAVLGGMGSEAGGQFGEGTRLERPLRFAGGVLGALGGLSAARFGTGARATQALVPAAEEAGTGGRAAGSAPPAFYRGDQAGLTEFRSPAAQARGQANSEAVLAKGDKHELMAKHAFDNRNPLSPYISITTDPEVARSYGDTVYRLQLAPSRAVRNPFSPYSESEYLVPHYISPDEIKGTLP